MLIISVLLLCAAIYGATMNILQLAASKTLDGLCVLRAIGIFFVPMGIVLGFVKGQ